MWKSWGCVQSVKWKHAVFGPLAPDLQPLATSSTRCKQLQWRRTLNERRDEKDGQHWCSPESLGKPWLSGECKEAWL